MKTTELKFRPLDSHPQYKDLQAKLANIAKLRAETEPKLRDMESRALAHTRARTKETDQAAALLKGETPGDPSDAPTLEEITTLRERVKILGLAKEIGEGQLKEVAAKASLAICEEARPQFTQAWKELAEALVEASEQATRILGMYGELDAAGISRSALQVALPLEALDARNADGRINGWVTEIEKSYAVQVKRESLTKAERIRYELHMERENRKQQERVQEAKALEQRRRRRAKEEVEA